MTTVRPILYTEHPEQWLKIMTALGGEALVDQDGWALGQLDRGRVAFHSPMEDYPKGQVDLCLEVEDLDAWAEACGTTVEEQPFGRAAKVSTDGGMRLAAHAPSAGSNHHDDGPLRVMPIWVTPDVEQARKTLKTAGLRERIASDSGAWVWTSRPTPGWSRSTAPARAPGRTPCSDSSTTGMSTTSSHR